MQKLYINERMPNFIETKKVIYQIKLTLPKQFNHFGISIVIIFYFFSFSSLKDNLRNEFKMYSTTKLGRVYLSNIQLRQPQTSKYLWNVYTFPVMTENHPNSNNAINGTNDNSDLPNSAAMTTGLLSVNNTLRLAAYFAVFGILGFSMVWLFLIFCVVYDNICPW